MGCVLGDITDDVINNAMIASKGLIRLVIVVFPYGGNVIWCLEELEPTKQCYESCENLALFIQWALVVAFHGIKFREDFALSAGMLVAVCACVADWYHSLFMYWLRWDRSTHILILSESFFGVRHTTLLVG